MMINIYRKISEILSQEQTVEAYEARKEQIAEIYRPAEEQIAKIIKDKQKKIAKINKYLEILKDFKTKQSQQYYELSSEYCQFRRWTIIDHKKQVLDRQKQILNHGKQVLEHKKQVLEHEKQVAKQIINKKAKKQIDKICESVEKKIMFLNKNLEVEILKIYNDIQDQKQTPEQTSKKIESVSLTKPKNQSQFMRSATTILKSNKSIEQPKIEQLIRAEQTFKSIEQLEAGQMETDIGF